MGILMRGVKRDDVKRGMIVAKPGSLKQYDRFKAQIYMMTKEEGGREKPLTNGIQESKCPTQTEPCSWLKRKLLRVPLPCSISRVAAAQLRSSPKTCIKTFLRQDLSIGDALNSQNDFLQLSAFSKTWDCSTYVSIEDGKDLFMPGEDGTIVARLVKQQALEVGQTFTLRDGAHTVGTGKVCLV